MHACAQAGPLCVGRLQLDPRRHAPLSRALLRGQGRDGLACSTYAGELSRWNIETTIIVPGSFTTETNHFANAGKPSDAARMADYESDPRAGVADQALKGLAGLSPHTAG